jgi:AcrR family transcriptional regulator
VARRNPPQQPRAKQTRGDLLAAAARVFAERGFTGATVDDVAEAAGCSKGAYYFHFASKEEALLTLLDDWARDEHDRLETAQREAAPGEGPRALVEALLAPDPWASPGLILEFWTQGERSREVSQRLARVQASWRRALIEGFERTALAPGVTPDGAAELALAVRDGLTVRAASAAARREAARSLLAALEAGGLRRAG